MCVVIGYPKKVEWIIALVAFESICDSTVKDSSGYVFSRAYLNTRSNVSKSTKFSRFSVGVFAPNMTQMIRNEL